MRLLVLGPARDEPSVASTASAWLDRLEAALAPMGVRIESRPWTDPGDLYGFDGVSPLMAWGYHQAQAQWDQLLVRLAQAVVPVVNGVEILRWNTRKTYLSQLDAAGAPVVPTLFVEALTQAAINGARDRFGDDIIVKPQVSGGAFATLRLDRRFDLGGLRGAPSGPAMLQPFMPAVAQEGELSLLYFNGVFSHAVAKVAPPGDFRVQSEHGGCYRAIAPPQDALDAAERVLIAAGQVDPMRWRRDSGVRTSHPASDHDDFEPLRTFPRPALTYARIDLIRDPRGELRLMELEAIEPDLYLEHAADSGAAFAQAMLWALD